MNYFPLPIFIFLIIILPLAQACKPVDKGPNTKVDKEGGYKNLKLDSAYDSLKKLVELQPTFTNQCTSTTKFKIKTEPYTAIGPVHLDKVELEFVRDSLCRVILYRRYDYETSRQLHQTYRAAFGEPSEERETLAGIKYTRYKWTGARAYIHIIQRDHSDVDIEYGSFSGLARSRNEAEKCSQQARKRT